MARQKRKGKKRKEDKKRKKRKERARIRRYLGGSSDKKSKREEKRDKKRERRAARASSRDSSGGKKKSGKKKTKKAAKRIKEQLRSRADKGNDKAREMRNRKVEKSPKNLGRRGQSGEAARRAAQRRQAQLARNRRNNSQNTLSNNSLVDPNRLMEGTMSAEYKAMMDEIGNVKAINDDLKLAMTDLRTNTANEKAEFQAEIDRNKELMADLQFQNTETVRAMQEGRDADKEMYNASLVFLQDRYEAQEKLNSEAQQFQQLQARKAENLASAYVPGREDSLASVKYGDNRKRKRKGRNNRLSELRVSTAIMPRSGSSTAGLQLA